MRYFQACCCAGSRGGKRRASVLGLTLLEVMLAVTILLVVVAAASHGLVYSNSVINLQEQRTSALNDCRSIVAELRRVAYSQPVSPMCPGGAAPMFPCVLLNWLASFPSSFEEIEDNEALVEQYGDFFSLPGQTFEIACRNANGDDAVMDLNPTMLSANTNPAYISVTTRWRGLRGRTFTVQLNAILTDR